MQILQGLDKITAAGILARAALSIAYSAAPGANAVANEDQLRANIIEEARQRLGLDPDDFNEPAIEKIGDFLDEQADELVGSSVDDFSSALDRLAERGDLPSDLYQLDIVSNISALYGKGYELERKLIERTVQNPDFEQHFGADKGGNLPAMASLFARHFRTRWPMKDFISLVGAQRKEGAGRGLVISQAWRIYPSRVDLGGSKTPLDWLQRFTDVYGAEMEVNGRKAKFFNYAELKEPISKMAEVGGPGSGKPREIIISDFTRIVEGKEVATLITAVDSDKYLATIKALGVREADFIDI